MSEAGLDRRVEAVVLVGTPVPPPVQEAADAALAAGLDVAVVADDRALERAREALWDSGIGPGSTAVVDVADTAGAVRVLDDQRARREAGALPDVRPEPGWGLVVSGFDTQEERVHESLLAVADGRLGTSGAPLARHPATRPGALHAGVYDGDGPDSSLLGAPLATQLHCDLADAPDLRRVLDLRAGLLAEQESTTAGEVAGVRFAALSRPGALVLRTRCPDAAVPALTAPDGNAAVTAGPGWMRSLGACGGVSAALRSSARSAPDGGQVVDVVAAYVGDPDSPPAPEAAVPRAEALAAVGFERLLGEQRHAWAARWADADVVVPGDEDLQLSTRLMLFHLMGSVADEGEAALGARGLTGPGYKGHVFWDADTFGLPFLAATHPASARAMLEYRVRRLPQALAAARALGRDGARYPWESARTGDDVTPESAYDRAGRVVPVLTGALEEHIVAEVAWATACYLDWTGDAAFSAGAGLRLLVETARYWASRIEVDDGGSGHVRGVIGPDEYHEDVDDDCFTNVMARWNLRRAADAVDHPGGPRAGVGPAEVRRWRELAAGLVDGYDPTTGRHEQFAGFSSLEPLIIAEIAPRRPIAADVLMEHKRLQGSQVVKQAAVLMAHHLVPDELPPGSLAADLGYYEPRTAHGSSLSPGVHAALLARAGRLDRALDALEITAHIDTHDLTRTTAAGVHLATAGALWQALVQGFAGVRPRGRQLVVDPHVPARWGELAVHLRFRGSRVRLTAGTDTAEVRAEPPAVVEVGGLPATAGPRGLRLRLSGRTWEVA